MQQARLIGFNVQKNADKKQLSPLKLGKIIGCSEAQVKSLYSGRMILSFHQLSILANEFGISISELLSDNFDDYCKNVVHCMNAFDEHSNCERILDIIDDYMDVIDSIKQSNQ